MKQFSDTLLAALEGPATTLAYGWRLTRSDGLVLGFTDHDEALTFAGTRFEARTGLSASEAESETGLAATTQEVAGALSSDVVTEADILAGRYDGARVETFLVQRPPMASSVSIISARSSAATSPSPRNCDRGPPISTACAGGSIGGAATRSSAMLVAGSTLQREGFASRQASFWARNGA